MEKKFKIKELPPTIDYSSLIHKLVRAHSSISELRGVLSTLKNPNLLVAPMQKKEAISSSAIEGTHATMEEVLKYEAQDVGMETAGDKKTEDIKEIINYDLAMSSAIEELKARPIGENLIKKVHKILLDSVRGQNKNRGEFRVDGVYIGEEGHGIDKACYIPPAHTDIPHFMSNWEKYLHSKEMEPDALIRAGVFHYQFEAIHPFKDGNGRMGRLLIPLFLFQEKILPHPVLYISGFFDQHRNKYHKLLNNVDVKEEWVPWLEFFLEGVDEQARNTMKVAKEIQVLYEKLKIDVMSVNSKYSINLLDQIFVSPIISFSKIKNNIKTNSPASIYSVIEKFVDAGILTQVGTSKRNRLFIFNELMAILNSI